MKIRRGIVNSEIDYLIGNLTTVSKKKEKIVDAFYNMVMGIVVSVINDTTEMEFPERVRYYFDELENGSEMHFLFSGITMDLVGKLRKEIIEEGIDERCKYKFVKNSLKSDLAVDRIVIDLDYTMMVESSKNQVIDPNDEVYENPSIDKLNEYFS